MELLSSNIKIISENGNPEKTSLYFKKWKPQESFLYFAKWNLSVHPDKISYISRSGNTEKIPNIFSKESCSCILGNGNPEKILIFQETETFLYFRKRNFLVFQESYIQNPSIFRTRSIFRTLAYSEPEGYSEHCQTSTMKSFAENSYLPHFLIFRKMQLFYIFTN